jgi:hypothetical protein
MESLWWLPIAPGILGGGAMGAVITAVVTHFRNRIQPVGYQIQILPIFVGAGELGTLALRVIFTDEEKSSWAFDNLYVMQIDVENRGNQDKENFDFGITLSSDAKAIFVITTTQDRHHKVQDLSKASPSKAYDFASGEINML